MDEREPDSFGIIAEPQEICDDLGINYDPRQWEPYALANVLRPRIDWWNVVTIVCVAIAAVCFVAEFVVHIFR